jgi:predicted ATP-binding protein involved in virulence
MSTVIETQHSAFNCSLVRVSATDLETMSADDPQVITGHPPRLELSKLSKLSSFNCLASSSTLIFCRREHLAAGDMVQNNAGGEYLVLG